MSFIAIDARADVTGSKKGKLTPAQHAQLNAWCLASKTGILDCLDKCEAYSESYAVSNNQATIKFKAGYIVICGRLVECEDNTIFVMSTPASPSVTQTGKIILRYNLSNFGNNEFVITTKTGDLVQEDLNDNPSTGTYEFELYSYIATSSSVVLTRTNTDYIPDIGGNLKQFITSLTGTGVVGSGNPPLQGYNTEKGTIEERLTDLGFKTGSISGTFPSGATLTKKAMYATLTIPAITVNPNSSTNYSGTMTFTSTKETKFRIYGYYVSGPSGPVSVNSQATIKGNNVSFTLSGRTTATFYEKTTIIFEVNV